MLEVECAKCGPFEARGWYQVSVTLYNGNEPTPAADGSVVSACTAERFHKGGELPVALHSGVALSGVHIDAASRVVFEVLQRKASIIGAAPELCAHLMRL